MKKLLLLIFTLGVTLMSCNKQETTFKGFTEFKISTSNGLGVWCEDALDVVITDSTVIIYHDKPSMSNWVNNGSEIIYIAAYKSFTYALKPKETIRLPLTL